MFLCISFSPLGCQRQIAGIDLIYMASNFEAVHPAATHLTDFVRFGNVPSVEPNFMLLRPDFDTFGLKMSYKLSN